MVMEPDRSSKSTLALRGRSRGMRTGYTTGSCATAATRIALLCLLGELVPEHVTIALSRRSSSDHEKRSACHRSIPTWPASQ